MTSARPHRHKPPLLAALSAFCLVSLFAVPAFAGGVGEGSSLALFGKNILSFMSGTLGPIILAIGLGFAAAGIIFGMPGGLQKALMAGVGGILLVCAEPISRMILGWGGAA